MAYSRAGTFRKTILAGVALAAIGLGAMPVPAAQAQDTETQAGAGRQVDTITVTARRREETLNDVPVSLTVQTGAELSERGVTDITGLQQLTPNLTLQVASGTNSTLTAFIRGIGQQDPLWGFEPGIGLYVDDVYIARPQGAVLDILDVERIEVLRGPQGTLYGRNTIGGAVKYVTARMGAEPEMTARVNVGTYNQLDVLVSGSTPVGDMLHVGGAIGQFRRNGFGTNLYTGADQANKDVMAGRVAIEFTPTDSLFFRLSADRVDDDSNANHGHRETPLPAAFAFPPATLFGVSPPLEAFAVPEHEYDTWAGIGDRNEVITQGVSLTGEWVLNDTLTLKSISAYRDGVTHSRGVDFDGTPAPILDVASPENVYEDHQFSQEFQAVINRDRWQGIAGVYYLNAAASGAFDSIVGLGALAIPGAPTPNLTQGTSGNVDTRSYAVFGDFSFDITERWAMSLGGRWTRDEKTATVFKANYLGLGSPITGVPNVPIQVLTDYENDATYEEFTPRVSVSYALNSTTNVYAAYSRGFKSGGFDMRGDATATPATEDGYAPETVDSFELGLKGVFLDGRLQFTGAVFHADYQDQQVTSAQPNASGVGLVSFVDNAGSSTIQGVEAEGQFVLNEYFTLDFGVGYVDASFDEFNVYAPDGSGGYVIVDVADQRAFENTPKWNGHVGLSYETELNGHGALLVRGDVSFRDSTQVTETPVPAIDQDAYELYNLSAVWTAPSDRWEVGLYGRNLSDERYHPDGNNFAGLAFGDSTIAYYAPPRTVFASVTYRY